MSANKPSPPVKQPDLYWLYGGPIGCLIYILTATLLPYILYFSCNENGCTMDYQIIQARLSQIKPADLFHPLPFLFYLLWLLIQCLVAYLSPHIFVEGPKLLNRPSHLFKINGFISYIITSMMAASLYNLFGPKFLTYITQHYLHFLTSSVIFSYIFSLFLFFLPEPKEDSDNPINSRKDSFYNWFFGKNLNPRIGESFDIKLFVTLRFGLLTWMVLNFAFLIKQFVSLNGYFTDSMMMTFFFQALYVADSMMNEINHLFTPTMTKDKLGWKMVYHHLVIVPFIFSTQTRYLSFHPIPLGFQLDMLFSFIYTCGYFIYRASNSQKNRFRRDPNEFSVKDLKYLKTEVGSPLLISGWWGIARHINYLGDWLIGISWCLPCGFASIYPYTYQMILTITLIHRLVKDNYLCSIKYGKDWDKYKSHVPNKIIPGIF